MSMSRVRSARRRPGQDAPTGKGEAPGTTLETEVGQRRRHPTRLTHYRPFRPSPTSVCFGPFLLHTIRLHAAEQAGLGQDSTRAGMADVLDGRVAVAPS